MKAIKQLDDNHLLICAGWSEVDIYLLGERKDGYINYSVRFRIPVIDKHLLELPNVFKVKEELVGVRLADFEPTMDKECKFLSKERQASAYVISRGAKVLSYFWKYLEDQGHESEGPVIFSNNYQASSYCDCLPKDWQKSYPEDTGLEYLFPQNIGLSTSYCKSTTASDVDDFLSRITSEKELENLLDALSKKQHYFGLDSLFNTFLRNQYYLDDYSGGTSRRLPTDLYYSLSVDEHSEDISVIIVLALSDFLCRKLSSGEYSIDEKHAELYSKEEILSTYRKVENLETIPESEEYHLQIPIIPVSVSKDYEANLAKYNFIPNSRLELDISEDFPEHMTLASPPNTGPMGQLILRPSPISR